MRDYRFIPYEPDKPLELAPDIRKWLPPDHLALFISEVVDTLDLREITEQYLRLQGGHPAYHPAMMLKLLFYGYCVGIRSSRRIEQKTYEDVAFRVLSCDSHPDHSRISDFRRSRSSGQADRRCRGIPAEHSRLPLREQTEVGKRCYPGFRGNSCRQGSSEQDQTCYARKPKVKNAALAALKSATAHREQKLS